MRLRFEVPKSFLKKRLVFIGDRHFFLEMLPLVTVKIGL